MTIKTEIDINIINIGFYSFFDRKWLKKQGLLDIIYMKDFESLQADKLKHIVM